MTSVVLSIVCTTSGGTLPAGGPHNITFGAGELATGSARISVDYCVSVQTTHDGQSNLSSCSELSTWVQSVSMVMNSDDQLANIQILNDVLFYFTTQSLLSVGGNISILLPAGFFTGKMSPVGRFNSGSGNAVLSNCWLSGRSSSTFSWLQIDCGITSSALQAGSHSIGFSAGELTTGIAKASTDNGLRIMTSSDSASYGVSTPALAGVTNASMIIASVDQFAFQTTTKIVSFMFVTMKPMRANSLITITLPEQYFTGKTDPTATIILSSGAFFLSSCSLQPSVLRILCPTAGFPVAAGLLLMNFAAGELTVGTVFKLTDHKGAIDVLL
jgi:hypothetical protein